METQVQSNKITCQAIKVICALSSIFLVLIINSCGSSKIESQDDYVLVDIILKQQTEKSIKPIYLSDNSNNSVVVSLMKELRHTELTNYVKLDSVKKSKGITGISILEKKLNLAEYDNYILQQSNSKWNTKQINIPRVISTPIQKSVFLEISKPIYSRDKNIAFVQITKSTTAGIAIFTRENGVWKEHKSFNNFFLAARPIFIPN